MSTLSKTSSSKETKQTKANPITALRRRDRAKKSSVKDLFKSRRTLEVRPQTVPAKSTKAAQFTTTSPGLLPPRKSSSCIIQNTIQAAEPNIIERFRTSRLSSDVNKACVNYNKLASRTLSVFNNEMSDILRKSIAHLDTISLKVHATINNLQDEEIILSGLNSYSRLLEEQRKYFECCKPEDNVTVAKEVEQVEEVPPSEPKKVTKRRKNRFRQVPLRSIRPEVTGKKTVMEVLANYSIPAKPEQGRKRKNPTTTMTVEPAANAQKSTFQLRMEYSKQLHNAGDKKNKTKVVAEAVDVPDFVKPQVMMSPSAISNIEDMEMVLQGAYPPPYVPMYRADEKRSDLDMVLAASSREISIVPLKSFELRKATPTSHQRMPSRAETPTSQTRARHVGSLTINIADDVTASLVKMHKCPVMPIKEDICGEDEKVKLLKEKYILKTISRAVQKKLKRRSVDICLPQNFRKIKKNKMVNECYVNEKFEDSLWFGPKLKQKLSKCSVGSCQNKLRRRDGDFNLLNFAKPKSKNSTTRTQSSVTLSKVYDKKCCVIMETQKWSTQKYDLRQNSAIGTSCILDEITLKDLEPLKAEYPRRDHLMERNKSIEETFLYKLVHDFNSKPLEVLIKATPMIKCSMENCACKNTAKRRTRRAKPPRARIPKYPLENKAAIGDIHEVIETEREYLDYCSDEKGDVATEIAESIMTEVRPDVDAIQYTTTEHRRKLTKFMIDPSGRIPAQMYTVLPLFVKYDKERRRPDFGMGDISEESAQNLQSEIEDSEQSLLDSNTPTSEESTNRSLRVKKSRFTEVNSSEDNPTKHKMCPKQFLQPYIYDTKQNITHNQPPTVVMMVKQKIPPKPDGEHKHTAKRNFSNYTHKCTPKNSSSFVSTSSRNAAPTGESSKREKKIEKLPPKTLWNNKYGKSTCEQMLTYINNRTTNATPSLTQKTPAHKLPRINSPPSNANRIVRPMVARIVPIIQHRPRTPPMNFLMTPKLKLKTRSQDSSPMKESRLKNAIAQMETQIKQVMSNPSKQSPEVFDSIEKEIKDMLTAITSMKKAKDEFDSGSSSFTDSERIEKLSRPPFTRSITHQEPRVTEKTPLPKRSDTGLNLKNIGKLAQKRLAFAKELMTNVEEKPLFPNKALFMQRRKEAAALAKTNDRFKQWKEIEVPKTIQDARRTEGKIFDEATSDITDDDPPSSCASKNAKRAMKLRPPSSVNEIPADELTDDTDKDTFKTLDMTPLDSPFQTPPMTPQTIPPAPPSCKHQDASTARSIEALEKQLGEEAKKFCEEVDEVIKQIQETGPDTETHSVAVPGGEQMADETVLPVRSDQFLTPFMHAVKKYRNEEQHQSGNNFIDFMDGLKTITDMTEPPLPDVIYDNTRQFSQMTLQDATSLLDDEKRGVEECNRAKADLESHIRTAMTFTEKVFLDIQKEAALQDIQKIEADILNRQDVKDSTTEETTKHHGDQATGPCLLKTFYDKGYQQHKIFYDRHSPIKLQTTGGHDDKPPTTLTLLAPPNRSDTSLKFSSRTNFDIRPIMLGAMENDEKKAKKREYFHTNRGNEMATQYEIRPDSAASSKCNKNVVIQAYSVQLPKLELSAPLADMLKWHSAPKSAMSPHHFRNMLKETIRTVARKPEVVEKMADETVPHRVREHTFLNYVYGAMFATVFFGLNMNYKCQ